MPQSSRQWYQISDSPGQARNLHYASMVRQSDRSAVLAEAERPRAEGHDVDHAPHDAHILEEMIELILVLLRVHCPEVVKDDCGRDEEQEDRECCPARLPAED